MDLTVRKRYSVSGMHCASCAHSVSTLLSKEPGVRSAEVHFAGTSAVIEYNSAETNLDRFHELLQPFGFDVLPAERSYESSLEQKRQAEEQRLKRRNIVAWICALPVVGLSMWMDAPNWTQYLQLVFSVVSLAYAGAEFFEHAWKQARIRQSSMDTLIALSTGLAVLWSIGVLVAHDQLMEHGLHPHLAFESAVMVIAFVLLGKSIEARARHRSGAAIESLKVLQPARAFVRKEGQLLECDTEELVRGDTVVVRTGESVPVDGIVREGSGSCDEKLFSGESAAARKTEGDLVFAGTVLLNGTLVVETTSASDDTLLASIRLAVQEAQETKITAQRLVDFVSQRFVPSIIVISLLTFVGWLFFAGTTALPQALNSMIAVLVVACPCALGLAAPTAIMVAVGRAADLGVLVRNADVLERAAEVDDIIFDKTGTLTTVVPDIDACEWIAQDVLQTEVLSVVYAAERHSRHPIAHAICQVLSERSDLKPIHLDACTEYPGRGVEAVVADKVYSIGSARFMKERGYEPGESEGVFVALQTELIARIPVQDAVTASTRSHIKTLREMGYALHILSGDHDDKVQRSAQDLGIVEARSQCTPEMKELVVKDLQDRHRLVAMVGDGVNDAQSLARADFSIAMGRGTDVAMNASDIVLLHSQVASLTRFFRLSSLTRSLIRQNLVWAFAYNVLLIPLAAGVFLPLFGWSLDPMYAGAAMALSSISVVSNSLRLNLVKID